MKKLSFILLITLLHCSDKGEKGSKITNAVVEEVNVEESNSNKNNLETESINIDKKDVDEIKNVLEETNVLYDELMSFKDNPNFHKYGFSGAYKYNEWLKKVGELKNSPKAKEILFDYGFSLGDLEMLGLEYVKTKGRETKYSNWAKDRIENGLKQK